MSYRINDMLVPGRVRDVHGRCVRYIAAIAVLLRGARANVSASRRMRNIPIAATVVTAIYGSMRDVATRSRMALVAATFIVFYISRNMSLIAAGLLKIGRCRSIEDATEIDTVRGIKAPVGAWIGLPTILHV